MKNNNIFVNVVALVLFGLVCFGAGGDVAYAAAPNCPATPITVVNQSLHSVVLQGEGNAVIIPPKSTIATTVQSKYFYSRCGLIHLSLNPSSTKSGLISPDAQEVALSIRTDDRIEQIGMTAQGFDLDEYLKWHGYRGIL